MSEVDMVSCPGCNGTGDQGGNPDYGACDDCNGHGKIVAISPQPVQDMHELPEFAGLPLRKLETLLAQGWVISGYALHKDEQHGFITTGGFVGWHASEDTILTLTQKLDRARSALLAASHFVKEHYAPAIDSEYALMTEILATLSEPGESR